MKITFMGSPEIGAIILSDIIANGVNISSVITQPDKPKGRSKKPIQTEVKQIALKNKIKVFEPKDKVELIKVVKDIKPDLCIVAAYGMIIPKEALKVPKYGMINFHPSLLPELRGPSPITMAIMCGLKKTGVTIMQVSEKMDAGDILAQKEIKLFGNETTPELSNTLARLGSGMINKLLLDIKSHNIKPKRQDSSKATYTKMVKKADGEVFFKKYNAQNIEQAYRAFIPWPGVFTSWNNKKLDLFDIKFSNEELKPGEIKVLNNIIIIGCKKGSISVDSLKIEGKNKVTAEEFLRGYPSFVDSVLN